MEEVGCRWLMGGAANKLVEGGNGEIGGDTGGDDGASLIYGGGGGGWGRSS